MDRQSAVKLVRDTFEAPFDKARFLNLTRNILKKPDVLDEGHIAGNQIPHAFADHIASYERLAKYTDPEDRRIDVLRVTLRNPSSLERARTMQRNFIARYLNGGRGDERQAALVAFTAPGRPDWRFSLVKVDYHLVESGDKVKAQARLTPSRRWSFLMGEHESSHTAQSRLAPILEDDRLPALEDIEGVFNVEVVSDEFFEQYRVLRDRISAALGTELARNPPALAHFTEKLIDSDDFAEKLLGQVVFLYFVQKKGWLGVRADARWGAGPRDFLRRLFEKTTAAGKNFFNDALENLFYDALAVDDRRDDYYPQFECRIPFLNGGLFEPIGGYEWHRMHIRLPDGLFSNSETTQEGDPGTGVLDLFDRYNFTVCEDEPLDKEVAVDPEMLGKVFERMLGDRREERKQKGTYYTPREVVQYMCQEALINHLDHELKGSVERSDIELLIRQGETLVDPHLVAEDNESKIELGKMKSSIYRPQLTAVKHKAHELEAAIRLIRVCDPAIGSGAFPVGMMAEIVRARSVLARLQDPALTQPPTYRYKLDAIQNSLYGVDIDPGAIEIARLRLWLSLVVDEDDPEKITALPNLDYKIMQGDSLLEDYKGIKLFDEALVTPPVTEGAEALEIIRRKLADLNREAGRLFAEGKMSPEAKRSLETEAAKLQGVVRARAEFPKNQGSFLEMESTSRKKWRELKQLQADFVRTPWRKQKQALRNEIESLTWEFITETLREQKKLSLLPEIEKLRSANIKPFFLWKLHFGEVFEEKGGFDVVVANPPYVRAEKIGDLRASAGNGYQCTTGSSDLYVYFYERGYQLLRDNGTLAYISSNKYFRSGYGRKLREFLASRATIQQVIDFGDTPVFGATAYPSIIVLRKTPPGNNETRTLTWKQGEAWQDFATVFGKSSFLVLQKELTADGWRLEPPSVLRLLEKIRAAGKPLGEYVNGRMYRGVVTGLNEAFVVDRATRDRLIAEDVSSAEVLKPFLRGRDIKRWRAEPQDLWLIFTRRGIDISKHSAIEGYLRQFKKQLTPGGEGGRKPGSYKWYEIQDPVAYWQEFERPKIIYPDIYEHQSFAVDKDGFFSGNTCYFIPTTETWLCALLNSSAVEWFYSLVSNKVRGGYMRAFSDYMEQIPVPVVREPKVIEEMAKTISSAKARDPEADVSALEHQIDELAYKLYGLTPEEIALIEDR